MRTISPSIGALNYLRSRITRGLVHAMETLQLVGMQDRTRDAGQVKCAGGGGKYDPEPDKDPSENNAPVVSSESYVDPQLTPTDVAMLEAAPIRDTGG